MENNEILNQEETIKTPEETLAELQSKLDNEYVPKSEAESWKQKYYKAFQDRANGVVSKPENKVDPEAERKQFEADVKRLGTVQLGKGKSAHEHLTLLLKIRDYNLKQGKEDIFAEGGQEMADMIQDCLDKSDGNDNILATNIQNHLDFGGRKY